MGRKFCLGRARKNQERKRIASKVNPPHRPPKKRTKVDVLLSDTITCFYVVISLYRNVYFHLQKGHRRQRSRYVRMQCNRSYIMSTFLYRSVHLHFQTVGQKGRVLVVPNIVHYRNQAVVNLFSLDVSM